MKDCLNCEDAKERGYEGCYECWVLSLTEEEYKALDNNGGSDV